MSYSNITVVTAQGTYGYELGTSISYNTLDLIADIPHDAQLEIERIFSTDRNGLTATIPNFLNDVNVSVVDKQKVFLIPVSRCTFNTATKQITAVNLPASGNQVYNFTYIPISGANVGIPQTIAVPALQAGDNIIVRRKTVSNTPLVQWVPGSKLTTAQLNLNTLQMLYLIQEILNKVTIVSISTEQILDNAIISSKILNKAVTFSKLQDLSGPLKLLGSGSDPINFQDVREMSVGPGFDVVGNVIDVKPIAIGQRNDINVVAPNSDWRINPNAVTYAKMQAVAAANRVLGSTTAGGAVSEVQVNTNMLADNAVTFAKMQSVSENVLIGRTSGSGNLETIALSAAGRELINDATVADMRQTLQLGSAALSATGDFATASHNHTLANISNAGTAAAKNAPAVGVNATTTQVVMGDDTRLTDSRTPVTHTHGNISNAGAIGTTANLPIITGTSGVLQAGAFGTTANTFCQGNDSRLSDARTPTAHEHAMSDITSGTLGVSRGGTGVTATPTNGQLLIGNGTGFSLATLTAGTNITITNNQGAITITSATQPVAPNAVLSDGTYGDINISGNTWTVVNNAVTTVKIANSQVTLAKLQNIATNKLLGRATAGSGVVEEIDLTAAGRALLDDASASAQRDTLGLGTSATLNVASTGDAASGEVVKGNDTRLTNTRTPTDGTVTTAKIVNSNVTYGKIQNVVTANRVLGSVAANGVVSEVEVQTDMVANLAITGAKIANSAISAEKIAADAVTTAKVLNANITEAKIADGAVTNNKIANNAVTFGKLPTMVTANRLLGGTTAGATISEVQVNTNMVLDNAITTAKIADANVTSGKLASGVAAANLGTGGVTASLLATDAVTTLKILDLNVTSSKIANNAITNGKLRTSAGTSLIGRAGNTVGEVADITAAADGQVLMRHNGMLEFRAHSGMDMENYSIPPSKLEKMVTTNRVLGSSAVDGAISATQVTSGMIADGAVTAAKLAGDLVIPVANLPEETKYTFASNQVATGSTVTFTGIPANAKRITLVFWALSSSPTAGADVSIRVGGSSIVTSGYVCISTGNFYTTSFTFPTLISGMTAAGAFNWWGTATLHRLSPTSNGWIFNGSLTNDSGSTPRVINATGSVGVGSSLTQIQIFLSMGTFDNPNNSISLYYEV